MAVFDAGGLSVFDDRVDIQSTFWSN